MIRRFFRHIKEGFVGFARHFGMAMSSCVSVTITLLLIGMFAVMTVNLNELTNEIEDSISLSVLLSYNINSKSEQQKIIDQVKGIENVNEVEFRSKNDEFDFYLSMYPDLSEFYELYRDQNPFHDALMVGVDDVNYLQDVKGKIEKIYGIDSVHDGGSNTYTLISVLEKVRIFGGALVVALSTMAVYLIYNTIRITIASRSDEIWIMRNVGAKNGYIRAPFLVEGVIIGALGSLIPIGCIAGGYYYLYELSGGVILGVLKILEPYPFILYASFGILGLGIFVGFLGSYLSVCKFLRSRR